MANWCLIESDPGVFTELIESFGVRDVEVSEVLSFDAEELRQLGNAAGLDRSPSSTTFQTSSLPSRYSPSEIRFNLLALVRDRRSALREQLEEQMAVLMSFGVVDDPTASLDVVDVSNVDGSAKAAVLEAKRLQRQLDDEEDKRRQWKKENERRKHNYIPLFMQLTRELAKAGVLPRLLESAKEKYAERMREHQHKALGQYSRQGKQ
ncbi:hypothetical protein PTSG_08460 [Salpingoeca rosetta]|uniref:ubiquitinyl hydrolase 1 n=1 Tax=Salpingoeca rosetta (strain ATCC 50818 / BSB-021) TaxID=946362 RepID=F2UJR8_SALR5|nr:uncharacterized protein PTSG_08460 [Salpingoeca rosetta]EGD77367.1 hypothetical protein PTSG_08460 [Salpingoeca rosetta]|eukprot:XP_004990711.1 hypothetical protein PTSG_08460 [Salpingoeca rosetta]